MNHLSKKPDAAVHALAGADLLTEAMGLLGRAELALKNSGYRGAAHGVHQAKLRVDSWRDKVYAELAREGALNATIKRRP